MKNKDKYDLRKLDYYLYGRENRFVIWHKDNGRVKELYNIKVKGYEEAKLLFINWLESECEDEKQR